MTPDNVNSNFIERVLPNGLKLCLEPAHHMPSAACGFLVQTGSRDETPDIEGVSHFLEHMCFKGTAKRDWVAVNRDFDLMGSRYNAFTSNEKTMYYGWVPKDALGDQTALLADMMRSSLPEDEFNTEKNVILEEIAMYEDNLGSCMFDLARKTLFENTPLALSVLGTKETISPLKHSAMQSYFDARYVPNNMIFVASGNFDPDQLIAIVEKETAHWKNTPTQARKKATPSIATGTSRQTLGKFTQQAIMLCFPAPAAKADDMRVRVLSDVLAGGNSRMYWDIIQTGLCMQAGAFHLDYSDTGVFVLYAICSPEKEAEVVAALRAQAKKIYDQPATEKELTRVCNHLKMSIAKAGDAPMKRLMQIADDVDVFGRGRSLQSMLDKVAAVKSADIATYLEEFPLRGDGTLIAVGPNAS